MRISKPLESFITTPALVLNVQSIKADVLNTLLGTVFH